MKRDCVNVGDSDVVRHLLEHFGMVNWIIPAEAAAPPVGAQFEVVHPLESACSNKSGRAHGLDDGGILPIGIYTLVNTEKMILPDHHVQVCQNDPRVSCPHRPPKDLHYAVADLIRSDGHTCRVVVSDHPLMIDWTGIRAVQ